MQGNRIDVGFSGDLGDPWVRAIREAIPGQTAPIDGAELPDRLPELRAVVMHRATVSATEADRLGRLRERGAAPRIVLVVGPHVRYHQIMAWSGLVDAVLPEATARETIARHVDPRPRPVAPDRRVPVAVVSGQFELARMIEDTLEEAGYLPERGRDDLSIGPDPWVVWDVPVLEADWPDRLALAANRRKVVAMLGLADRETVAEARERGAVACLDLPCDPGDLIHVLDRLTIADVPPTSQRRADLPRPYRPRTDLGRPSRRRARV